MQLLTVCLMAICSFWLGTLFSSEDVSVEKNKQNFESNRKISSRPKTIVKEKIIEIEKKMSKSEREEFCQTKEEKEEPKKSRNQVDREIFYEETKEEKRREVELMFERHFGPESGKLALIEEIKKEEKEKKLELQDKLNEESEAYIAKNTYPWWLYYHEQILTLEKKYHQKIKNALGNQAYEELYQYRRKCNDEAQFRHEQGGYWGYCPNY